jgi:folate-binding protein YgfZ
VSLDDASGRFAVAASWGDGVLAKLGLNDAGAAREFAGGVAYADPRLSGLGARFLIPRGREAEIAKLGFARADDAAYDKHRLSLGVPDGSRDLEVEKSILLENGFEELNGVDFAKGCYMGQELTARTKYRGLVRKRLMPVTIDGPAPAPGTAITLDGAEAGEMRSSAAGSGLALIRLEQFAKAHADNAALLAGETRLRPMRPAWAVFESETATQA